MPRECLPRSEASYARKAGVLSKDEDVKPYWLY